ncbi:MAG: Flp pilus assembly complex ATPase component TadA [Candidatus Hydrogenedentes bacterium]|nr:Flp pilus assembly complex ATPase component TadA [Candidatus Hydrogenedentota bacterium]
MAQLTTNLGAKPGSAGGYSLFGQKLVEKGIITQRQLDEAIHRQQTTLGNRRLGEILVRLGYISKSHISEGLAEQLGIPIIRLSDREVPERIRNMVDPSVATLYKVVPIGEDGPNLLVATADPTNVTHLDNLERLLDRTIIPQLTTPEEIKAALQKYYGMVEKTVESMLSTVSSASTMSTLSTMSNVSSMASSMSSVGSSMSASDISLSSISVDSVDMESSLGGALADDDEDADSPVVRYINHLILEAFRLRASDIHVEPGKMDVKIRYRIDGILHLMPPPPKRAQPSIISRLKIMSGMDISERRIPQDGRIKIQLAGKMVDLRVSALPATHGESVVMRILDKSGLMLGLGQLGFAPEDQRRWEELLGQATGVVLVTGPTGSGKTTTLYASLHQLNQPDTKLITVEDPVEYQLKGINQVQVNHDIGWNFSRALRSIFRQDPDIVMVGEIRDQETAEIAIKAALTGHLVFSTLHTNDAPSAFIRLIDIGIRPFLVAAGVRAVLGQRLVRTICTTCKEVFKPEEHDVERLGFPVDWSKVEVFHGAGCDNCNHTGYSGRLGVYELMIQTDHIRNLIMEGMAAGPLRRAARQVGGMTTMREDAWKKVLNGVTTIEEVIRVTQIDEPLKRDK